MPSKYEYKVIGTLGLPVGFKGPSPMMDSADMTKRMNEMAEEGWDYVGPGVKRWADGAIQDWWIFRREKE